MHEYDERRNLHLPQKFVVRYVFVHRERDISRFNYLVILSSKEDETDYEKLSLYFLLEKIQQPGSECRK